MRRTSLIASLAVAGLALAACGGDDGDDGSTTDGEASGEVEVFTWWAAGGEKAGLDGMVSVFEQECPDFEFVNGAVAGGAGSNAKQVLASRLQTNEPPDTFQAHAGAELTDYIEAEQIEDVSGLYEEFGLNDAFPEGLVESITVDGSIYSIPANIHRANIVWANPSVLQGAGVSTEAPADVDAWLADLETLRSSGIEAPLAIATDWTQTMLLEAVLIAELGPDGYSELYDGGDWSSSDVTAALEKYGRMLEYANTDRASLDWPDALNYVTGGQAAYTLMGDWVAANLDLEQLAAPDDYVYWPAPGTDGVYQWLADSFVLPVGAPNPEGTECWLSVVGSADGQREFNVAKGSIPARTDAEPADYPPYQQSAMQDWAQDTLAPSLAHGSAGPIGWIDAANSAVGQFSSSGDVGQFQEALSAAAESQAG
ncbi:MAG: ABC transporter substrate-binding protein [Jiangellaceae bacterium]